MKIVYIYTALLEVGGVDRIVTQKANYMADVLGYDVYIVTDSQNGKPTVFPLSERVKHIDLKVNFDQQYHHGILLRTWYYFRLMRVYKERLTKLLDSLQPDFVITTLGRDMDFLTNINEKSLKIGESHVVKEYCRNFHQMERKGGIYKLVARYWRRKQEKAVAELDALVLLTQRDKESWDDVCEGVVIPNAVAFYPEESSPLTSKRCISVGRYVDDKGYRLLIDAWNIVAKRYPDWRLECFGQGDRSPYQAQVEQLGLQGSISLNGPSKDIQQEYLASSIYVMPSLFEGFGLVLVEAMACGVPCVSFNCPFGPADIIQNGVDGILVPAEDVSRLAEGICRLIEKEDERKQMGRLAKEHVARYKEENVMGQWVRLFEDVKKEYEEDFL